MKNNKTEYPGVVESVSRFAGVFVGTLVVGGKEIANCVKDMTKPKLEPKPYPTPKPKAELKPEIEPIQKQDSELMPKPIPKPELKVSAKIAEKSVKSPSEKKSSPTVKKKTTPKRAKVKKKVERPKSLSRGQNRHPKSKASAQTKVIVETPKTQGPTAKAKQSSGKSPNKKSVEAD